MPSCVHHVPPAVTAIPTEDMTGRIPVCYGKRKSNPGDLSGSQCSAELNRYTTSLHSRKCKIYKTRCTFIWLLLKDLTSASTWPDMSYIFISTGTSHPVSLDQEFPTFRHGKNTSDDDSPRTHPNPHSAVPHKARILTTNVVHISRPPTLCS